MDKAIDKEKLLGLTFADEDERQEGWTLNVEMLEAIQEKVSKYEDEPSLVVVELVLLAHYGLPFPSVRMFATPIEKRGQKEKNKAREIKFRVWDVINKKMLSWKDIERMQTSGEINTHTLLSGEYANYKVMQYIERKDKNGKDIYEGDILRKEDCGEIIEKVMWTDDYGWTFESGETTYTASETDFEETEVIGNIYENPQIRLHS